MLFWYLWSDIWLAAIQLPAALATGFNTLLIISLLIKEMWEFSYSVELCELLALPQCFLYCISFSHFGFIFFYLFILHTCPSLLWPNRDIPSVFFYSTIGINSLVTPAQFQPNWLLISMWCISEKDCSILKQHSALNADLWWAITNVGHMGRITSQLTAFWMKISRIYCWCSGKKEAAVTGWMCGLDADLVTV